MGCCTNAPSSKALSLQSQNPIIQRYLTMMQVENSANVNNRYQHVARLCPSQSTGTGLRKTCAYDCLQTRDEMLAKRVEFWETRTTGKKQSWMLIKELIETEFDDARATKRLRSHGLTPLNNSYMMCVDQSMHKYDVPIFCINEAKSYSTKPSALAHLKNSYVAQAILIKVRSPRSVNDIILNIPSTGMLVSEVKEMYRAVANLTPAARIRLFFNGREMLDAMVLGNYNIQNESVVQAMIIGA